MIYKANENIWKKFDQILKIFLKLFLKLFLKIFLKSVLKKILIKNFEPILKLFSKIFLPKKVYQLKNCARTPNYYTTIANHSPRSTASQLKCVSDTISSWFENHQPQEDKNLHRHLRFFLSKLESNGFYFDRNHKFSEGISSTPVIFKATSKLFGSEGCSDDKNWLDFSSIFFKICGFRSSILLSL